MAQSAELRFLIIEDKTETSTHDDQLKRYKASAEREYNGRRSDLCFAYVKTGNEPLPTLKKIEKTGFRTVNREDILSCLEDYDGNNCLLLSYREHLQEIEGKTISFKTLPEKRW